MPSGNENHEIAVVPAQQAMPDPQQEEIIKAIARWVATGEFPAMRMTTNHVQFEFSEPFVEEDPDESGPGFEPVRPAKKGIRKKILLTEGQVKNLLDANLAKKRAIGEKLRAVFANEECRQIFLASKVATEIKEHILSYELANNESKKGEDTHRDHLGRLLEDHSRKAILPLYKDQVKSKLKTAYEARKSQQPQKKNTARVFAGDLMQFNDALTNEPINDWGLPTRVAKRVLPRFLKGTSPKQRKRNTLVKKLKAQFHAFENNELSYPELLGAMDRAKSEMQRATKKDDVLRRQFIGVNNEKAAHPAIYDAIKQIENEGSQQDVTPLVTALLAESPYRKRFESIKPRLLGGSWRQHRLRRYLNRELLNGLTLKTSDAERLSLLIKLEPQVKKMADEECPVRIEFYKLQANLQERVVKSFADLVAEAQENVLAPGENVSFPDLDLFSYRDILDIFPNRTMIKRMLDQINQFIDLKSRKLLKTDEATDPKTLANIEVILLRLSQPEIKLPPGSKVPSKRDVRIALARLYLVQGKFDKALMNELEVHFRTVTKSSFRSGLLDELITIKTLVLQAIASGLMPDDSEFFQNFYKWLEVINSELAQEFLKELATNVVSGIENTETDLATIDAISEKINAPLFLQCVKFLKKEKRNELLDKLKTNIVDLFARHFSELLASNDENVLDALPIHFERLAVQGYLLRVKLGNEFILKVPSNETTAELLSSMLRVLTRHLDRVVQTNDLSSLTTATILNIQLSSQRVAIDEKFRAVLRENSQKYVKSKVHAELVDELLKELPKKEKLDAEKVSNEIKELRAELQGKTLAKLQEELLTIRVERINSTLDFSLMSYCKQRELAEFLEYEAKLDSVNKVADEIKKTVGAGYVQRLFNDYLTKENAILDFYERGYAFDIPLVFHTDLIPQPSNNKAADRVVIRKPELVLENAKNLVTHMPNNENFKLAEFTKLMKAKWFVGCVAEVKNYSPNKSTSDLAQHLGFNEDEKRTLRHHILETLTIHLENFNTRNKHELKSLFEELKTFFADSVLLEMLTANDYLQLQQIIKDLVKSYVMVCIAEANAEAMKQILSSSFVLTFSVAKEGNTGNSEINFFDHEGIFACVLDYIAALPKDSVEKLQGSRQKFTKLRDSEWFNTHFSERRDELIAAFNDPSIKTVLKAAKQLTDNSATTRNSGCRALAGCFGIELDTKTFSGLTLPFKEFYEAHIGHATRVQCEELIQNCDHFLHSKGVDPSQLILISVLRHLFQWTIEARKKENNEFAAKVTAKLSQLHPVGQGDNHALVRFGFHYLTSVCAILDSCQAGTVIDDKTLVEQIKQLLQMLDIYLHAFLYVVSKETDDFLKSPAFEAIRDETRPVIKSCFSLVGKLDKSLQKNIDVAMPARTFASNLLHIIVQEDLDIPQKALRVNKLKPLLAVLFAASSANIEPLLGVVDSVFDRIASFYYQNVSGKKIAETQQQEIDFYQTIIVLFYGSTKENVVARHALIVSLLTLITDSIKLVAQKNRQALLTSFDGLLVQIKKDLEALDDHLYPDKNALLKSLGDLFLSKQEADKKAEALVNAINEKTLEKLDLKTLEDDLTEILASGTPEKQHELCLSIAALLLAEENEADKNFGKIIDPIDAMQAVLALAPRFNLLYNKFYILVGLTKRLDKGNRTHRINDINRVIGEANGHFNKLTNMSYAEYSLENFKKFNAGWSERLEVEIPRYCCYANEDEVLIIFAAKLASDLLAETAKLIVEKAKAEKNWENVQVEPAVSSASSSSLYRTMGKSWGAVKSLTTTAATSTSNLAVGLGTKMVEGMQSMTGQRTSYQKLQYLQALIMQLHAMNVVDAVTVKKLQENATLLEFLSCLSSESESGKNDPSQSKRENELGNHADQYIRKHAATLPVELLLDFVKHALAGVDVGKQTKDENKANLIRAKIRYMVNEYFPEIFKHSDIAVNDKLNLEWVSLLRSSEQWFYAKSDEKYKIALTGYLARFPKSSPLKTVTTDAAQFDNDNVGSAPVFGPVSK